jgi:hypothetical protein
MKTRILPLVAIFFLALAFNVNAQQRITPGQGYKSIASAGTPEALVSTNVYAQSVTLIGMNEFRTANTSTAYFGWTSTNDEQLFPITAGGQVVITAPPGRSINLKSIYIDVVSDSDTIVFTYIPD